MRVLRWAVLGLFAAGASSADERIHKYRVSLDDALRSMQVRACFSGAAPPFLAVESYDATTAFVEGRMVVPETRRSIAPNGTEMSLKGLPENACIEYAVNLDRARSGHDHSGNSTRRVGKDLFTEVGVWFWRPSRVGSDENIDITFDLPEGVSVSAPWRPLAPEDGRPVYRVGRGAYDRPSAVAFGRFREQKIDVPGGQLRLSILDGNPPATEPGMRAWIEDAARSVAAVYGRFPVPSPQILVMPGARAAEPTPWAYVLRGGQAAAHFFVNQRRPLAEYVEDWTAPHELSHLFLPYVTSNDAWLSEGMATYYQNVVRARSGAITPAEAWQRIHSGFRRGIDKSQKDQTLAQATERMFREGGYMRVYWHGTAILLAADVALRRRSDGAQSLDWVLERFGRCCLDPDVEWTARKVFEKFDEIAGGEIFTRLHEREVQSPRFMDLAPLYSDLGLVAFGGKVELRDDVPGAAIRDAIMARGPYTTPAALLAGRP